MQPKTILVTWRGQSQSLYTTGITLLESLSVDWDRCELPHNCFCENCDLALLHRLQTSDEWNILTTLQGEKQFYCLYNLIEYLGWRRVAVIMEICAPLYGVHD